MQVIVMIERTDTESIAFCDELQATASGATEDEALENLRVAIARLLEAYGPEVQAAGARRKAVTIDV